MSYYAVLMSGKHQVLLPAGSVSATSSDTAASASSKAMPRRNLTQNACIGCRKKRTKCDGRNPCAGCIVRKEKCDYEDKTYVTKDKLRAEVRSLRLETINSRAVLLALLGDHHRSIANRLLSGETVNAVAQTLTDIDLKDKGKAKLEDDGDFEDEREGSVSTASQAQTPTVSPSAASDSLSPVPGSSTSTQQTTPGAPDSGYDFSQPTPILNTGLQIPGAPPGVIYLQALPGLGFDNIVLDKPVIPLPLPFLPPGNVHFMDSFSAATGLMSPVPSPHPLISDGSTGRHESTSSTQSAPRTGFSAWTNVAADEGAINHLISLFFTWEFPPFAMIDQELFMRDYLQNKSSDFCSAALVNAIASLATRYLEENEEVGEAYLLGERFFREARKLLIVEARTPNIANIQAFGLLALRELSCGRECEAQTFCLQATHCIARLIEDGNIMQIQSQDWINSLRIAGSGVISLAKVIGLITPKLSPTSVSNPGGPRDRLLPGQLEERVTQFLNSIPPVPEPTTNDKLSDFICGLTDSIYAFLLRADDFGTRRVADQLHMVYQQTLGSYQSITDLLHGEDGKSSPFILFVHIYFQFSLLVLFHPFVNHRVDVGGSWPRIICAEATQAILTLAQSYDNLYTLRRMPCFAPYCVFAAGLTQIALHMDNSERKGSEGSAYPNAAHYASQSLGRSPGTSVSASSPGSVAGASPATSASIDSERYQQNPPGFGGGDTFMSGTGAGTGPGMGTDSATDTSSRSGSLGNVDATIYLLSQMSLGHPAASQSAWVLRYLTRDDIRSRQSFASR